MKTVEYRSLARYSQDKMQKNTVFVTKRVSTDIYSFESGQVQRSHKHDDADKIYFVLEGTGRFTVGRTTREIKAGMAILAPAGEEHGVVNMAEERLLVLVVTSPPVEKTP